MKKKSKDKKVVVKEFCNHDWRKWHNAKRCIKCNACEILM